MKIGIISDTHGCAATWNLVYGKYFSDADLILHAGDVLYHGPRNIIPGEYNPKLLAESLNNCPVPLIIAAGNCDAEVDSMVLATPVESPYSHVFIDNLRIIVNHGHKLTEESKQELAIQYKAKLFITGHTHVSVLEKKDGIIFLNPGSPAMSKNPDKHGTVAVLTGKTIEIIDIVTDQVIAAETLE